MSNTIFIGTTTYFNEFSPCLNRLSNNFLNILMTYYYLTQLACVPLDYKIVKINHSNTICKTVFISLTYQG